MPQLSEFEKLHTEPSLFTHDLDSMINAGHRVLSAYHEEPLAIVSEVALKYAPGVVAYRDPFDRAYVATQLMKSLGLQIYLLGNFQLQNVYTSPEDQIVVARLFESLKAAPFWNFLGGLAVNREWTYDIGEREQITIPNTAAKTARDDLVELQLSSGQEDNIMQRAWMATVLYRHIDFNRPNSRRDDFCGGSKNRIDRDTDILTRYIDLANGGLKPLGYEEMFGMISGDMLRIRQADPSIDATIESR